MIVSIISIVVILVLSYVLFTKFYPSFGGDVSVERQKTYLNSTNFKDGKFINKGNVPKKMSLGETLKLAYTFFTTKVENGRPKSDLEVQKIDSINVADYSSEDRLIWFGHSAFLLQTNDKNILIDPMFGKVAAPHPLLGANRFNNELPIAIEKLPKIDAIVISHDHYDHLDYESIIKLQSKVNHYYVPLGVGVHLEAWGVAKENITELDWWQNTSFYEINLVCTPSQHFSGRKMDNGESTLWSSWVITTSNSNIFFSGDSGYANHFKEIGKKYGPFDIALMECGQYNEKWSDIHMMPEETALAGVDVKAKKLMPIHWAGFKLALHSWTDPIERVAKKAKELSIPLVTPQIGEPVFTSQNDQFFEKWWLKSDI